MALTLDQLLASFDADFTKSASEEESKDDKDGKDEGKKPFPFAKKEDGKDEKKDDDKDEKKDEDDKDKSDKDSKGQEKEASAAGAALANEVMSKVASLNLNKDMNKQAQTAGQALARALLKQASVGDVITSDGIAPGATPTKNQVDNASMEAEGASYIKPMVTGDGQTNQGNVNQIFDALIADALSQGAASTDQVHEVGLAQNEGNVEDHALPNQVKVAMDIESQDEIEKAAAVSELVAQGINFEDAFEMVKQAELEINFELEKSAAMNELMADGFNFEDAVELVKQASAGDLITQDGISPGATPTKNQVDNASMEAEGSSYVKPMPTGDGVRNQGNVNQIFDAIVSDALSQGAASTDQVHERGVAPAVGAVEDHALPNQVKVAAINELMAAGVDFDTAVDFVKEAGAVAAAKAARAATKPMFRSAAPRSVLGKVEMAVRNGANKAGASAGGALGDLATKAKSYAGAAGNTVKEVAGAGAGRVGSTTAPARAKVKDLAQDAHTAGEVLVNPGKYGKMDPASNPRMQAIKSLAGNRLVQGVAAAGAVGAGAMALNREKKAAFDALVEAGIDFNEAAVMVAEKSQELYGQ